MNDGCVVVRLPKVTNSFSSGLKKSDLPVGTLVKPPATAFGLQFSSLRNQEIADLILRNPRSVQDQAAIVVTANIQHIATMRHNPEFRAAMEQADLITCDGFPVFRYAQYRGCDLTGRTTGREIVASIMERLPQEKEHKLFCVVDSDGTAKALQEWADRNGIADRVHMEVPPERFVTNSRYCEELVENIAARKPTLLLLCVGAPQSEIFAHRYRSALPPCWALCVGQSVKMVLGLVPTPPPMVVRMNVEWLWRMALEPRRLFSRYASSVVGFAAAVIQESRIAQA